MPRVRVERPAVAKEAREVARVFLRSYPNEQVQAIVPAAVLKQSHFTKPIARKASRQRFGRGLNMDRIENALRSAYSGAMRDLTDISRETIDVDPHLGSVLNKRFGALASLPWETPPASGIGIDDEKSMFYAEVCREQLRNLDNFRQSIRQLAWALFDGRACLEIKWVQLDPKFAASHPKYGKALWAIESLAWIHPRRLSFGPRRELQIEDEERSFTGRFSDSGLKVEEMPNKFVWWLPQLFAEYPEREGLAPRCLYWSFFKRFGARERMILSELFGKPWRIVEVDQESTAGDDEMKAADEVIDALGAAYTARLPRGTKLQVIQPGQQAGAIHADIIKSSDEQISKLVLGQTGTTDGQPSGMNNNQANVMQNEQLMILQVDAHGISEVIESLLTDRIIALNFGEAEVTHAPGFMLRSDLPADRKAELARLDLALKAGLSVKLDEAYDVSGFSKPNTEADVVIRMEQPPTPPGSPNAPPPRPVIVYPYGKSPMVGEQNPAPVTAAIEAGAREDSSADIVLTASDLGTVITVNEARASQNLGPLIGVDGKPDPDGNLTINEFKNKKQAARDSATAAATAATQAVAQSQVVPGGPPKKPGGDPGDDEGGAPGGPGTLPAGDPPSKPTNEQAKDQAKARGVTAARMDALLVELDEFDIARRQVVLTPEESRGLEELAADLPAWTLAKLNDAEELRLHAMYSCPACLASDFKQQDGPTGNPEVIVDSGLAELDNLVQDMSAKYVKAVDGLDKPGAIFSALNVAWNRMGAEPVGKVINAHMQRSFMMGALDNHAEQTGDLEAGAKTIENVEEKGEDVAEVLTAMRRDPILLARVPAFAKMAFKDAADFFKSLDVMPKAQFDRASATLKRRAFTVAGDLNDQMLATIQHELVKQIAGGSDLKDFASKIEARLTKAGFVRDPANPTLGASHVETVFRTNTLNSYNTGRLKQAQLPSVVKAFPTWEIRTAGDSRVRESHARLSGKRLLASDNFWRTNYPPFDYNCRCRVVSKRTISGVVDGAELGKVSERGFSSGTARLS